MFSTAYNQKEYAMFSNDDIKKITKISLIEKFVLLFLKQQYYLDKEGFSTIVYKIWRGKTYIIRHVMHGPLHPMCKCTMMPYKSNKKEAN